MVADGYTKMEAGNLFQYFTTLTANLGGLVLAVLRTFALCPSLGRSKGETRWVQVNFTLENLEDQDEVLPETVFQ